jgi:PAS domain S-box-containing protein
MASAGLTAEALEEALAVAGVGCWVWDNNTRSFKLSANFHGLLGCPADALPASPEAWLARTHPDEKHLLAALFDKLTANAGCEKLNFTLRLHHGSGMWSWFDLHCRRQNLPDGQPGPVLVTFNDVTQQKQAESALRDSQLRYRALYATSPLSFVQWDRQGRILEWNQRAEKLFGWTTSEVIGKAVHRLILPEAQREEFNQSIKSLIQGSGDGYFSGPALGKDGLLRHCDWHNVALRAPNGSLLGILSLILDQTDEHLAHQRLAKSEKVYRTLVETSPDGILLLKLDGRLTMANQQALRLFGLDELDDIEATSLRELLPETPDADNGADFLDNPDEYTGFIVNREFQMRQRNGSSFDAAVAFSTLMDEQGRSTGIVFFARDISERLQAERDLESHRQHLEHLVRERTSELETARASLAHIIDGSPVPILVLDAKHQVTHWNAACESLTGVNASEVIGTRQQWKAFYSESRPIMADIVIDGDLEKLETLYPDHFHVSRIIEHGIEGEDYFPTLKRWLFFTAAPLFDPSGNIVGAIETLQDVSERKQAEVALMAAKGAAEMAAKVKADFLANMSHEIRTPMNAIIGLAHLMLNTSLSQKQHDYVTRIQGAGQMLLSLINDILDFSKIEAGQMHIEATEFHLDDVLNKVTSIIQTRAQEKGLELHYVVDPAVPVNLIGDPLRLAQILINLLGNAIKFTAKGSVSVFFRAQALSGNQITLDVAVQDTGIGMSSEQIDKLFHAFSQADSSTTRKYGGTGLGLTICKRLCELMGGEIKVSSEPGHGSLFSFWLKLGKCEVSSEETQVPLRHVLVVDDNPLARNVLGRLLEKTGCQTVLAESGEQALGILVDNKIAAFDFITIDYNMPGMDGIELAASIRKLPLVPAPRLVMVTSTDTHELEEAGRLGNIETILHKPITAAQINRLLSGANSNEPIAPAQKPILLADTHILLVEDIPTNQLIAREILESFGAIVETADNGRHALEKLATPDKRFDIVLMDIQMPEMDGLEATRRIRASGKYPDLPIIAMTAHAFEEEKLRCQQAGMNDFLSKPIDPSVMQQVLLRWKPSNIPAKKNPVSTPSTVTDGTEFPDLPGIDKVEGLRRMMNKTRLYERVLCDFYQRFVGEAAAIRKAIAANDHESAERFAHSTKGLAGSIGAKDLQAASLALEVAIREKAANLDERLSDYENKLAVVTAGIASGFKII